jgi:hypothetical protein
MYARAYKPEMCTPGRTSLKLYKIAIYYFQMQNRNVIKVCSECGSAQSDHWTRHWKRQHQHMIPTQLEVGKFPNTPLDGWFEALPAQLQATWNMNIFIEEDVSLI